LTSLNRRALSIVACRSQILGRWKTGKVYDYVNVHRGSVRPLGPVVLETRTARDVTRFERELKKWLALPGTGP
jgi:hypothetical protein